MIKCFDMDAFRKAVKRDFWRCVRCKRLYPKPEADFLGIDGHPGVWTRILCRVLGHRFDPRKGKGWGIICVNGPGGVITVEWAP